MPEIATANPRAVIGDNQPQLGRVISAEQGDFASITTEFLDDEYAKQPEIVQALLDEASQLMRDPTDGSIKPIIDDEQKGKVTSLIKRMRDQVKALDAYHDAEKTPYLRGGQAIDQFFFRLIDRLGRREKKAKPGAIDILGDMLTDYDQRKLAEERERRRREAEEQERIAREAQEKAEREAREAEEARIAAERARKPEMIAAKDAVASIKEDQAAAAKIEASVAQGKAEEARIATLAKPADIMRTRGDDGTLSTMSTEPYAIIEDESKLDAIALWPFVKVEAKEAALRSWAKVNSYNKQMPGAKIGRKPKSVVR